MLVLFIFCIYIVIGLYDLKHKIIPDELAYAAVFLAAVSCYLSTASLLDWLAGPILFLFFYLVWKLSRGRACGLGDGKLALSIGLLLGFEQGLSAFALAFWTGTAWALLAILFSALSGRGKKLTMKSEVPFAPFLILGAWLALVLHANFFHI